MLVGRRALSRPSPSCSLTELLQLVSERRLTTVRPKPLPRMPARTPRKRSQMRFLGESVAAVASLLAAAMRRAPDVLAAPVVSPTSRLACQWPPRAARRPALRQTVLLAAWRRASWPLHRKAVVPPPSAKRTAVTELPRTRSAPPAKLPGPPMNPRGLQTTATESPMCLGGLPAKVTGSPTSLSALPMKLIVPPMNQGGLVTESPMILSALLARLTGPRKNSTVPPMRPGGLWRATELGMSLGGLPTKVTESPMIPSALLGNLPGPRTGPGRISTNLTVPPVSRRALLAKPIVPLANPCARATCPNELRMSLRAVPMRLSVQAMSRLAVSTRATARAKWQPRARRFLLPAASGRRCEYSKSLGYLDVHPRLLEPVPLGPERPRQAARTWSPRQQVWPPGRWLRRRRARRETLNLKRFCRWPQAPAKRSLPRRGLTFWWRVPWGLHPRYPVCRIRRGMWVLPPRRVCGLPPVRTK